jgi:hypothetical protein
VLSADLNHTHRKAREKICVEKSALRGHQRRLVTKDGEDLRAFHSDAPMGACEAMGGQERFSAFKRGERNAYSHSLMRGSWAATLEAYHKNYVQQTSDEFVNWVSKPSQKNKGNPHLIWSDLSAAHR